MSSQRSFSFPNCQGTIYIPSDLPPRTAPCPLCSALITSPAKEFAPQAAPINRPQVVTSVSPVTQKPITSRITSADLPEEPKSSAVPWIVAFLLILGMSAGAYFLYQNVIIKPISDNRNKDIPTILKPGVLIPNDPNIISPNDPKLLDADFIHEGWQNDAKATLAKFINAKTPSEKAKYVIGGDQTLQRLLKTYGSRIMDESESPADAFVPVDLGEEDSNRKIFMMAYDRPGQFEMLKFFRPLASIEIQHGVEELNPLLEASTKVSNFAMEPMKIQAYFKVSDNGMLIDWDVYLQTRHRTFQSFMDRSSQASSGIFRVIIVEDVPLPDQVNNKLRIYRVGDPAYINDSYRIAVPIGSELEKSLLKINWQGTESIEPLMATATIELSAAADETISISRLVCWEFAGLGSGEIANKDQSHKPNIISSFGESNDALVEPAAPEKQ